MLPFGLSISSTAAGDVVIIEPPGKALAGSLTIPFITESGLGFTELLIPSSGRFTQADLERLWDVGYEFGQWQAARMAIAGAEAGFGAPEIVASATFVRDWRAVAACAKDANALLSRWPTTLGRRIAWFPIGTPGGFEDLGQTERNVERGRYLSEYRGNPVVTRSARWLREQQRQSSAIVSSLARSVLQILQDSLPRDELNRIRSLASPIASVAQLAAPRAASTDPELSSWPVAFATFTASCLRTLAELQAVRRGHGVVPLLDTDELYETWLILELSRILDTIIHDAEIVVSNALFARRRDGVTYELWAKPSLSSQGRVLGGDRFMSLVAEPLIPDIALTATRVERTEVFILDAKAWTVLLAEDALEKSAKYLYGIRRVANPAKVPAIAGVDLVTCAPPSTLTGTGIARVQVVSVTPTKDIDRLEARVSEIIGELTSLVTD